MNFDVYNYMKAVLSIRPNSYIQRSEHVQALIDLHTVFPSLNAAAFICFAPLAGSASIRGRCLFEGGVHFFDLPI